MLKKFEKKNKDDPELLKEELEYLEKKRDRKLKKFVKKVNEKDIREKEKIYQHLGDFYYHSKKFGSAKRYFTKKLEITDRDIYSPLLFDVKDHLKLMHIHINDVHYIKAQSEAIKAMINKVKNKFVRQL